MKNQIDYIEQLCKRANPEYVFMHDEAQLVNIKVDGLSRLTPFVHVEVVRTGQYTRTKYGQPIKGLNVQIYFSKPSYLGIDTRATPETYTEVNPSGVKRGEIIDDIESDIVNPFIKILDEIEVRKTLFQGRTWSRVQVQYPPSRYNCNEISVMISFSTSEIQCQ